MKTVVYTKPKEMGYCQMCVATVRKLTKMGVRFTERNLYADEHAEVLQRAKDSGLQAAPIVTIEGHPGIPEGEWIMFSGFRPDLIEEFLG